MTAAQFHLDTPTTAELVISPTAETRKAAGGWRVTGKWFYNSGSKISALTRSLPSSTYVT